MDAEIPKSTVKRPRRQEKAFAELLAELEAKGFTVEGDGDDELGEAYLPHPQFEREYQRRSDGSVRFEEFSSCEGVMRVTGKDGPNWALRCDGCGAEWTVRVPTERLQEYFLQRAGIPSLFAGREFEKGDPLQEPTLRACREYVRRFKDDSMPAIALWGLPGRGKSHLVCLVVDTLIRMHGVEVIYRSMTSLLSELRQAIGAGVFEGTYERLRSVSVLALDDLGAERMTPAAQEWLAGLVDHRYSKGLPLLVATNIPPQAWPEAFGERTASRLRGLCLPFRLEGRDRRAQGVQESLSGIAG